MNKTAYVLAALLLFGAGALMGRWIEQRSATDEVTTPRKPLYYRNPMGLPDTSPVPKKDGMGMDYIPVYEGDEAGGNILRIAPEKVQRIGVRTEVAAPREIRSDIMAVGVIEADERSLVTIAPRFEGWIETLHVNETGRRVRRGEALFSAYSPELVAAQQEYLLALDAKRRGAGKLGDDLLQTARARLLNWQLEVADIRALEARGDPQRAVTLRAPSDGVVLEKLAVQGMRFMPGETLYRLADLGQVWLMASVYEQDIGDVQVGQPVSLQIESFPAEVFQGHVDFVYPTLDEGTRTARVRVQLPNADLRLRPGMYGRVGIQVERSGQAVLSVPDSAVLDSGKRQLVLVERGEGLVEPRDVVVGERGGGYVEIRRGIAEGDRVVVSANFLIDAESNLKAALDSFGHAGHGATPATEDAAPAREAPPDPADHAGHGGH
jgi:Cu(I)/Ag(I) efflux system membrane fusion protein